jgi:hypothetical protein
MGSASEVWKLTAVPNHEREELAGIPVAGRVSRWIGDGAEEPTEIVSVGPDGDVDLVATEKGNGCADAVDGGTVVEVALEVEAEALLGTPADGHYDVLRTKAVQAFEQSRIRDCGASVHGRYVHTVFWNVDSLLLQPRQIAFCARWAGHDPDGVTGQAQFCFEEKLSQVMEAGEAPDRTALQAVPYEDHECGVSDSEVRVKKRFAIVRVTVEVFEGWSCRHDEQTTIVAHDLNGVPCRAIEEVDAQDAVIRSWHFLHAHRICPLIRNG